MQILYYILFDLAVTSICILRRSKFQNKLPGTVSPASKVYLYRTNKITSVGEVNLLDTKSDTSLIGTLLVSEELYRKDGKLQLSMEI